jgi:hypothetical protein
MIKGEVNVANFEEKELTRLNKLYEESNELKMRMLKEIEKEKDKSEKIKEPVTTKEKEPNNEIKKKPQKKRSLQKKEVFYLKKLVNVLSHKKKSKRIKKLKKKHILKTTVEKKYKELNKIILRSKTLLKDDRELFAEAVLTFGMEGVKNVFNFVKEKSLEILGSSDLLRPISFIYLIIGIYKYIMNASIQEQKISFLNAENNRLTTLISILKENNGDMREAILSVSRVESKVQRFTDIIDDKLSQKQEVFQGN